jgi:hypothetical protein
VSGRTITFLMLLLSACSTELHVDGAIEHRVTLDASSLDHYFVAVCKREGTPTADCVAEKVGEFLEFMK